MFHTGKWHIHKSRIPSITVETAFDIVTTMSGLKPKSTKHLLPGNQEKFTIEIPCRQHSIKFRNDDDDGDDDDGGDDDDDMDIDNDLDDDYEEKRVGGGGRVNRKGRVVKKGKRESGGRDDRGGKGDKRGREGGLREKEHKNEYEEEEEEAEGFEATVKLHPHRFFEDDDSNSSGNEREEPDEPRAIAEGSRMKKGKQPIKTSGLPSVPSFSRFIHTKPSHQRIIGSLPHLPSGLPSILGVFRLFFPDTILKTIVINTNYYAAVKGAGESGRKWTELTIPELLVFLAIC